MAGDRGGEVIKGTLEMIILEVLQHEPMHGWGIAERIRQSSNEVLQVNQGALYPAVRPKDIRRCRLRLAPLNEQRRIVDRLDELLSDLDAGVAALERARTNLGHYRAAVLKAAADGSLTTDWRKQHPDVEPASALLDRILIKRRRRPAERNMRLWPLIAVLSLIAMVAIVAVSSDELIEPMGNFTGWSLAVFLTTALFGLASLVSIISVWRSPGETVRPGVRRFSWIVSIALLIATAYLAFYGMIGLRTWA